MKRVLERRKVERIMKNDTRKTVRGLLIAGVVVMAVSIMWPSLAEKYGTSKQTASNVLQSETSSSYSSSSASTSTSASKSTSASTSTASATYSHSAGGGGGSTGSFVNGASGTSSGSYSSSGSSSGSSSYKKN